MARFFGNQGNIALSPREQLMVKYRSARANLLLVVVFTLINIALTLFGGTTYFLFSAHIPYYIVFLGSMICGKLPADWYEELEMTNAEFLDPSALIVFAAIGIVITALYFLFWLLSKKKVGWLIVALVFFVIDTVFMFWNYGISVDMILDVLFHGWVIYYLASGVHVYYKLKALPAEEDLPQNEPSVDMTPDAEDESLDD